MTSTERVCNVCKKAFKSCDNMCLTCDECLKNYESPFKDSDFLLKKVRNSLRKRKGSDKYLYKETGVFKSERGVGVYIDYFDLSIYKYIDIYFCEYYNCFDVVSNSYYPCIPSFYKDIRFNSFEDAMVFVKKLLPIRK